MCNRRLSTLSGAVLRNITWGWQSREEVVRMSLRTVNPGKALREYDRNYQAHRAKAEQALTHPDKSHRGPLATEDARRASGARNLVNAALGSLKDAGLIEQRGVRGQAEVRLTPPRCCVHGSGCGFGSEANTISDFSG